MKKTELFTQNAREFLKKNKIILCVLALGCILILFSVDSRQETTPTQAPDFCQSYIDSLETRLSDLVCEIANVKSCNIMITLESGIEYVYARDESANSDENTQGGDKKEQSEEKITIVTDKQTGEQAVVITERYPKINGVSIICQAPNTPSLTLAIKNAAATALGIDSGKVCVILKG